MNKSILRLSGVFFVTLLLTACSHIAMLDPKGTIALHERNILIGATILMLIVVIPVIILSFIFAWRYRAKNKRAKYDPDFAHSNAIEAVCWIVPIIIIVILATVTWISTHRLSPYRPLANKKPPLIIQAVSLNWKWLFIYPHQQIATVNYIRIPVDTPVRFLITADAPMNSLEIPRLAGQIYSMPGMQTKLNLIAQHTGRYRGFAANFSGDGFSSMNFTVEATSQQSFDQWVKKVQASPKKLTGEAYIKLAKPSQRNPVTYYSHPMDNLYHLIIMQYMKPGVHIAHHSATRNKS